jgi:hypothetical protein
MPYIDLNPALAKIAPAVVLGAPRIGHGRNLQQMRTTLHLMLRRRTDVFNPDIADYSMLDRFINDAYLDVATMSLFGEQQVSLLINTDIDQSRYLLPASITTVVSVALASTGHPFGGVMLTPVLLETYQQSIARSGLPLEFAQYDGHGAKMLILYPAPDKIYELNINSRIEPRPLTQPEHCPYLDRQFHEAIELLARVKAHSALGEDSDTALANNAFVAFMQRRTSKDEIRDMERKPGSSVPKTKWDLRHRRLRSREDF